MPCIQSVGLRIEWFGGRQFPPKQINIFVGKNKCIRRNLIGSSFVRSFSATAAKNKKQVLYESFVYL